jgi:guanylate kinase
MDREGLLFVVSAPSGAGKTTLCKEVVSLIPGLRHSVSYTTRKPRPGELHGREYFFVDELVFQGMAEHGEFAEWARVYGHCYGTPRGPLIELMNQGLDVLLEIDTQGAAQIKRRFEDAVYIYILPPSIEALRVRLQQRGGDSDDEIQRRLQRAREEVWSYHDYSYIVRNDDMKQALKEVEAIILAERVRTKRLDLAWLKEHFMREHDENTTDRPGSVATQKGLERHE